jgi:hypothetical protein
MLTASRHTRILYGTCQANTPMHVYEQTTNMYKNSQGGELLCNILNNFQKGRRSNLSSDVSIRAFAWIERLIKNFYFATVPRFLSEQIDRRGLLKFH